jgi:hypothetical protein
MTGSNSPPPSSLHIALFCVRKGCEIRGAVDISYIVPFHAFRVHCLSVYTLFRMCRQGSTRPWQEPLRRMHEMGRGDQLRYVFGCRSGP